MAAIADEKPDKDFELEWVFTQYEDGEAVAKIAKILGRSESYVYSQRPNRPSKAGKFRSPKVNFCCALVARPPKITKNKKGCQT